MSADPITFSPSDIDQPDKQAPASVNQPQPVQGAAPITFSPSEMNRDVPQERTVKMYPNGKPDQVVDVPASQITAKKQAGYFPVLPPAQKAAIESQGIEPSASGNAALMAAPLAVPAAVGEAGEAAMAPVADAVSAAGDAIGAGARAMQDYALKVIGTLPKEGATSYLEQHGSGLLGLASQHPEVVKLAAKLGINAATLLLGAKGLQSIGFFGGK